MTDRREFEMDTVAILHGEGTAVAAAPSAKALHALMKRWGYSRRDYDVETERRRDPLGRPIRVQP